MDRKKKTYKGHWCELYLTVFTNQLKLQHVGGWLGNAPDALCSTLKLEQQNKFMLLVNKGIQGLPLKALALCSKGDIII